ncbi:MAG: sulfotransferase domain-containing protein [Acidobacteria bacterium]|nr:sulfotransferase domain-containing protein [Acidobacteriota bacterium]
MNKPQTIQVKVAPQDQRTAQQMQQLTEMALDGLKKGNYEMAVTLFKRALPLAAPTSPAHDVITHNLMTAYRRRIEDILKQPDVTPLNPYLREALALKLTGTMAQDAKFRDTFARVYHNLGLSFYRSRQHEAALACFRKAISIEPCPSYYVDLTMSLAYLKKPARLVDYTTAVKPDQLGCHIFITCTMKSGSTFLKNTLVKLTSFKDMFAVYASLQNEHELDLPVLTRFATENTVTQQHARASEANIQLMQAFGIRPVVLTRNVYDSVVSLLDFYRTGFTFSTYFDRDEFRAMPEDRQVELIIDTAIPWYFQFVASWKRAEAENRLTMHWLTYEELIADKPGTIERLLAFYGMTAARSDIRRIIALTEADGESNRFNKGVSGRGKTVLTAQQRERVARFAQYFPSTDFRCLGL